MGEVQILGQKALKAESYLQAAYPTTMGTERVVPALKEGSCPSCYFQSMSSHVLWADVAVDGKAGRLDMQLLGDIVTDVNQAPPHAPQVQHSGS